MRALIAGLLAFIGTGAAAEPRALTFATYHYARYDRAVALAPMAEHLGHALGRKVTVQVLESPDALAAAIREGRVDVAVTNLSAYLASARTPTTTTPVAMFDVPPATLDGYRGVLLARAGVDLKAAGLRYVRVIPGSTSGALAQEPWVKAEGLKVTDAGFAGTHDGAMNRLLDGSADIAALAEEPWRTLKVQKPEEAAKLVELWRSDPIPPGPVVCVRSAEVACDAVAAALTQPTAAAPAEVLSKGWSETAGATRLIPVDTAVYSAFLK
ncbi:PhnD/SsuA/transferrin family substrate-binding protein [Caulobacter segnis]|uniref:phosphate/phosphite/phosphonate ABC transporter substrate-binding protein n=1 Tax=Caulobacter segnis TaxID=88688 RepID=UPI00240F4424|nr:PhnD/SsuA/transferrin family substrate-binding protein [Caulobacter segnis]MDG2520853.1 PhnD/SsuA/transferrin family substrate-binding protein [Caulobacter segnis]